MRALTKRGNHISNVDFENIRKVDNVINRLKDILSQKISRPVAAFITFENQEGYERACNIKGKKNWKMQVTSSMTFLE